MSNQYNPLDDVPWQIRTQNPLQSSPAFSVVTDSLSPERFPQSQSAIYVAPLAVPGGRPKPPMRSPQHAMHMVSRRHSLPRTTTPRPVSTTTPRPPRPPSHILPFCCPRLFLADSAHATSDAAWQELPDRHMHWAPIHSRQSGRWRPEWVCMRSNATFDEDHPWLQHVPEPPTCPAHRPRRLALDLCEFSRGWACCRGSPPEVLPCPGERVPLPDPLQPALVGGAPEQLALVSTAPSTEAAWFNQGPSDNLAAGNTNSWLFLPLLHAAVGRLHPSALAAWEAHVHYVLLWPGALGTLRQAQASEGCR